MPYNQTTKLVQEKTKKIFTLIEQRGHLYIDGQYKNRQSILIIYCPIHKNEYATTFYNYKRSSSGCLCCSKAKVSAKLKNRKFSQKTILKMSNSAYTRPNRGGKPRRWRETFQYRTWRNFILQNYDSKCAVTGVSKEKIGDLEVHHFYSTKTYPNLIYKVENGIVLHKSVHTLFHKKYGYNSNTLEQFCDFLLFLNSESMPISSQGELENSQGSETRAYDPERVMKLHERLEKLFLC